MIDDKIVLARYKMIDDKIVLPSYKMIANKINYLLIELICHISFTSLWFKMKSSIMQVINVKILTHTGIEKNALS